jgi:hypothetical protein
MRNAALKINSIASMHGGRRIPGVHFGDDAKGWKQIQIGAVLAFTLPLFVLAVGSALPWAFRGFQN